MCIFKENILTLSVSKGIPSFQCEANCLGRLEADNGYLKLSWGWWCSRMMLYPYHHYCHYHLHYHCSDRCEDGQHLWRFSTVVAASVLNPRAKLPSCWCLCSWINTMELLSWLWIMGGNQRPSSLNTQWLYLSAGRLLLLKSTSFYIPRAPTNYELRVIKRFGASRNDGWVEVEWGWVGLWDKVTNLH